MWCCRAWCCLLVDRQHHCRSSESWCRPLPPSLGLSGAGGDAAVLQHSTTMKKHTATTHHNTPQHTTTRCNTLQQNCKRLQNTATKLRHTATHYNTLKRTARLCNALQRTATHCNTLQRTTTHCNTLQYTATAQIPFSWISVRVGVRKISIMTLSKEPYLSRALLQKSSIYVGFFWTPAEFASWLGLSRASGNPAGFQYPATLQQHTATTHGDTLQHTAKHCETL